MLCSVTICNMLSGDDKQKLVSVSGTHTHNEKTHKHMTAQIEAGAETRARQGGDYSAS